MKHVNRDDEISEILRKCKLELYRIFVKHIRYWLKEEDLQSYLYHLLVDKIGKTIGYEDAVKLVHREYPLLDKDKLKQPNVQWEDAIFGLVDLVVLESFSDKFDLGRCKITHAIELKFPLRKQRDGGVFCEDSIDGFVRGYGGDYDKLSEGKNKIGNKNEKFFRPHILFFEKFRGNKELLFKSCENCCDMKQTIREKAKKEENRHITFDGIQFSYMEINELGGHSKLLNNCDLPINISR